LSILLSLAVVAEAVLAVAEAVALLQAQLPLYLPQLTP
jgi:hypothetical protein